MFLITLPQSDQMIQGVPSPFWLVFGNTIYTILYKYLFFYLKLIIIFYVFELF